MKKFDKVEDINQTIENSPKAIRVWGISMKIISIVLIMLSFLLCVAVPVVGIVGIVLGVILFYVAHKKMKNSKSQNLTNLSSEIDKPNNTNFKDYALLSQEYSSFIEQWYQNTKSFPPRDYKGHRALTVREADIYGTGKVYDGVPAQSIITKLNIGDPVILEISAKSDAVKVYNLSHEQIGSLPEWKDLNEPKVKTEVYYALCNDCTVLAKVSGKYNKNNGTVGVIVDICRYAIR